MFPIFNLHTINHQCFCNILFAMICLIFPQIVTSVAVFLWPRRFQPGPIWHRSISVQQHGIRVRKLPSTQHLEVTLPQLEVPIHVALLLYLEVLVHLTVEVHGDLRVIGDHPPLGPSQCSGVTNLSSLATSSITSVQHSFIILNIRINYSCQLSSLSHCRHNNSKLIQYNV